MGFHLLSLKFQEILLIIHYTWEKEKGKRSQTKMGSTVFNRKTIFKHKVHKGYEGKMPVKSALFPPLCTWCPSCLGSFPPETGEPKNEKNLKTAGRSP
jgi:hypothetical protein